MIPYPDDVGGAELATRHLLEKGHQKIGFIGIKASKTTEKRLQGYKKALHGAGLEIEERYIEKGRSFNREEGYALAHKLYRKCPDLTALFVYNDIMAAGVLDALHDGVKDTRISRSSAMIIAGRLYTAQVTTMDLQRKWLMRPRIFYSSVLA